MYWNVCIFTHNYKNALRITQRHFESPYFYYIKNNSVKEIYLHQTRTFVTYLSICLFPYYHGFIPVPFMCRGYENICSNNM